MSATTEAEPQRVGGIAWTNLRGAIRDPTKFKLSMFIVRKLTNLITLFLSLQKRLSKDDKLVLLKLIKDEYKELLDLHSQKQ